MLAFRVEIDGDELAIAGVEDWAVLALHVAATRSDVSEQPFVHADASVGGLTLRDANAQQYHFRWKGRDLKIGSRIVVTLVDTDSPTAPVKRYRSDSEVQESTYTEEEMREMRREDYLELKKEFGGEHGLQAAATDSQRLSAVARGTAAALAS